MSSWNTRIYHAQLNSHSVERKNELTVTLANILHWVKFHKAFFLKPVHWYFPQIIYYRTHIWTLCLCSSVRCIFRFIPYNEWHAQHWRKIFTSADFNSMTVFKYWIFGYIYSVPGYLSSRVNFLYYSTFFYIKKKKRNKSTFPQNRSPRTLCFKCTAIQNQLPKLVRWQGVPAPTFSLAEDQVTLTAKQPAVCRTGETDNSKKN